MLRALLFDFNGILVDDEPLHLALFQRVLGEEGIELAAADYYRDYLGLDDAGCLGAVLARQGGEPSPELVSRLVDRKAEHYQTHVRRHGYPFFPGAVELVREAAAAGLRLGIVSGALRGEIVGALGQASLAGCFAAIVAAEDVAAGKPDPEGYRRGLELLASRPPRPAPPLQAREVAAIEDSVAGLTAAAGAGLLTVGVAQTYPPEALTAADAVAPSLAGLRLADLESLCAAALGR